MNMECISSVFRNKKVIGFMRGLSIVAIGLAISCSQPDRSHRDREAEVIDSNVGTTDKAQIITADINMNGKEKAFIATAYSQSLYIWELATLALKSNNTGLQTLAKAIANDQNKLITDLEKIAKGKGLLLERTLSTTQQKDLDALKKLSSSTLDQQFLQQLLGLQSSATVIYQEGLILKNTDLNDYANNAMKIVQAQQATTAKLLKAIESTNSQGTRPGEVGTQ